MTWNWKVATVDAQEFEAGSQTIRRSPEDTELIDGAARGGSMTTPEPSSFTEPELVPGTASGPDPDRLVLVYREDPEYYPGTGCVYGGQLVLTAAHLLAGEKALVADWRGRRSPLPARVEWSDSRFDLALLRVMDPGFGLEARLMLARVSNDHGLVTPGRSRV